MFEQNQNSVSKEESVTAVRCEVGSQACLPQVVTEDESHGPKGPLGEVQYNRRRTGCGWEKERS